MKGLAGVLLATGILFALTYVAVKQFRDRELFVPPPDAVAEAFFRALTGKRFDQARDYVAHPERVRVDDLKVIGESIENRIGRVHDVKATVLDRNDRNAAVMVRLRSATGSDERTVQVTWSDGRWAVVQSPL